jgi:hypothetical protein
LGDERHRAVPELGDVGVTSLGRDVFAGQTPGEERIVEGFEAARQLAHDLDGKTA